MASALSNQNQTHVISEPILRFDFAGSLFDELPSQIAWAVGELEKVLEKNTDFGGVTRLLFALSRGAEITQASAASGVTLSDAAEAFAIFPSSQEAGRTLYIYGADLRGLIYAITEIVDRVRYAADPSKAFDFPEPIVDAPSAKVRSISKCFQSEVEDLPWFHDREGWKAYLTQLVSNRFNRFALTLGMQYNYPYGNDFLSDVYFYLAYPFLVSVPGHNVSVSNLSQDEVRRNLETLKFIAREADRRGLEFQLALWTQSYDFEDCPDAKHQISGLGPDNIAEYCRDALAIILREVPEISGLTLRVHVECGIAEGDYGFWRTYFDAVKEAGRSIRLDLHAKGIDRKLIETALATGMPVGISPKYTSEHLGLPYHQASIRALEGAEQADGLVIAAGDDEDNATLYNGRDIDRYLGKWQFSEGSRKFMRYSYGDLMREDRPYDIVYRIWPGTIRVLLWGDPVLAGGYGRHSTFSGSQGVELCEPLSFKGRMGSGQHGSRTGYQEKHLIHQWDWQKFDYTYRVWGRSLYNPEDEPAAFQRYLRSRFGNAADGVGAALASASRILPLITLAHTPTASNNSYWPEMYENMSILRSAPQFPYGYELIQPARFGTVGSSDPQMFMSPREFATRLHDGRPIERYAPLTWANWLERHATHSGLDMERALETVEDPSAEMHLVAVDVTILSAIGRFFAHKIRAAVFWEYFLLSDEIRMAHEAFAFYNRARDAWQEAAEVCKDVYLPDITYGPHSWLRGRWDDRLPAIEQDIEDMGALVAKRGPDHPPSSALTDCKIDLVRNWSTSQQHMCHHVAPENFVRGQPVELSLFPSSASRLDVTLHYRRANQAEPWVSVPMLWKAGGYHGMIAGDYTQTDFPLLYYFEIAENGVSAFYPGLAETLSNAPYMYLGSRKP